MASIYTSQVMGVTGPALEAARRRVREAGGKAPYSPAVSGLSESDMERSITRAQLDDQDVDDAVGGVREMSRMQLRAPMSDASVPSAPLQLRAPMTGAPMMQPPTPALRAPGVAPNTASVDAAGEMKSTSVPVPREDLRAQATQAAADRIRRRRLGVLGLGLAGAVFGDSATSEGRNAAVVGALQSMDPNAPFAEAEAARARDAEAAEAQRRAAIEDEDRAVEHEYRRSLMRSMDVNSDRREFEMQRRGTGDERLYDPTHPLAMSRRSFLQRVIATAPGGVALAFQGMDLDSMGARDLQGVADQVLRRIGQVPNRERSVDEDALRAMVDGLDDTGDQAPAPEPIVEEPPTRRTRVPGAAPTPGPAEPPAAPRRRDRTVAEINADVLAERDGQPTSTGRPAREMTPGERLAVSRALERSRTREAGAIAAGIDTRSREAQGAQVADNRMIATPADVARIRPLYARVSSLASNIDSAIREFDAAAAQDGGQMSQARFAAMQRGGLLSRLSNTETLQAIVREFTNAQLRDQSGAAVTESEAQRFFSALNLSDLNTPEAFRAALVRGRRHALRDLQTIRNSNPAAYDAVRGRR